MNKNHFRRFIIFLLILNRFFLDPYNSVDFVCTSNFFWQLAVEPAHSHTLHDGDHGPLTILDCFYSTTMMVLRFSFPLQFSGLFCVLFVFSLFDVCFIFYPFPRSMVNCYVERWAIFLPYSCSFPCSILAAPLSQIVQVICDFVEEAHFLVADGNHNPAYAGCHPRTIILSIFTLNHDVIGPFLFWLSFWGRLLDFLPLLCFLSSLSPPVRRYLCNWLFVLDGWVGYFGSFLSVESPKKILATMAAQTPFKP